MTSFPWKVASQARSHSIAMSGPGHTGMLRYWSMGPFQDAATAQMSNIHISTYSKVLISQRGENLNVIFSILISVPLIYSSISLVRGLPFIF